jgi:hypothetical protein
MKANRSFLLFAVSAALTAFSLVMALGRLISKATPSPEPSYNAILSLCGRLLSDAVSAGRHYPYLTYPLLSLLAVGLLAGSVTLFLRVTRTRRLVRSLAYPRVVMLPPKLMDVLNELKLAGRVDLVASDRIYSFCHGFLRPRICLTTGLVDTLNEVELRAVLLHEKHHLKSYDPLKGLMADSLTAALFFVPLLAALRDGYCRARELAADDSAMQQAGRLPLAGAMYKLLTHPLSLDPSTGAVPSLSRGSGQALEGRGVVGAVSVIDQRLDYIMGQAVVRPWQIAAWRVAASLLLIVFLILTLWMMPASISSSTSPVMSWHGMETVPDGVMDAYCALTLNASCCLAGGAWPPPFISLSRSRT